MYSIVYCIVIYYAILYCSISQHKGLLIPMSGPMSVQCRLMSAHVGFTDIGSDVGLGQTDVGSFVEAKFACRVRCRVWPNRRRTRHGCHFAMSDPTSGWANPTWAAFVRTLPPPCENIRKTYETDSLTCRTRCRPMCIPCQRGPYMSGPMSAYVYPMSGPLSIWCFTCRVLCRPMCILCRILCEMAYPCRVLCRPYVGPMSACL